MKRALFFAFAFLLGTIATGVIATRAKAEDPKPAAGAREPAPWEYRVFLVDIREFRDKEDWKAVVEQEGGNEFRADPAFKAYILNHLAKDGWELVQVLPAVRDKNEIVHFYLRRPRAR